MNAYATLGLVHAASRSVGVRTAGIRDAMREIEKEWAAGWAMGEPHPADAAADTRIRQLRMRAGTLWQTLASAQG